VLLDDIVDYLSSAASATFPAGTIRAGLLQPDPDVQTAIYETGGQSPVHAMNPLPGKAVIERPRIQVVCRAGTFDYAIARSTAHVAFKLLDGLPDRLINGTRYKWGSAVQSPFLMGRDDAGRVLISCNYDIIKELTP